ncbi:MAG: hypothetical protein B7Z06_02280 [Flavobacteriales bacterium 32-35-8]|nr:MAG: hypothetical protein B7Z06_02280 [Flavobacteriales bacterium 32-35-8]
MKQGWEMKRLKEVCAKITDGTHQTPKYFDEGYIFLSSKNVTSGKIDWENIKYIDEKQHIEMYKRVAPKVGDILLAKNGTTGVAAMVDRDVVFDIYVSLAHLSPLKNISAHYLLHFINSPLAKNQFNKRLKGAGVPNLHLEEIREVEIPLPPLPEQQRIVSILDEAFAAIAKAKANAEQNLKNAKELFESYLQGVFENKGDGWEEKTLGDVCTLYQGIAINAKTKHALVEKSDLPLLRIKDLKNNTVEQYIDPNNFPKNALVKEDDIIYTRTGSLGLVFRGKKGVLHNNSFKVVPNNQLDKDFLFIWLQNPIFKSKIMELALKAAQPDITHAIFKIQEIAIPTLKEQQTIVRQLDALRAETQKLEAVYQKKIADLEELKKSILQKAFAGELQSPEGARYANDGHSPSDKKKSITSPEGA